jgi:hypothetical protein
MQLHEQRDQMKQAIESIGHWKLDMQIYLHGPKFSGEGNDYINVNEMLRHLENLQRILNEVPQ